MKFSCDECHAQYMIADEKVGERGVKVKCKKCGHVIIVRPPAAADTPEPASEPETPAPAPAAAADEGGGLFGQDPSAGFGEESAFGGTTQMMSSGQLDQLRKESEDDPSPDSQEASAGSPDADSGPDGQEASAGSPDPDSGADEGSPFGGGEESVTAPATSPAAEQEADTGADSEGGFGALSDDLFGGSGFDTGATESGGEFGDNGAEAPAESPAGEREWYVAIDESQVGPIDMGEVQQKWLAREVDEDTLAWKAGMPDWTPVAEVPELAYLVTEHPQHAARDDSAEGTGSGPASGAVANLSPVAFGGSVSPDGGAVAWKPSAASALSSLVQEELSEPAAPAAPEPAAAAPAPAGLPDIGGAGMFGGPAQPAGGGGFAPAPDFGGGGMGFAVPQSRPSGGGSSKVLVALAVIMGVAMLGLLGVLVWKQLAPAPAGVAAAPVPGGPAPAPAPGTDPTAVAAAPAVAPAAPSPAAAPTAAPTAPSKAEPKKTSSKKGSGKKSSGKKRGGRKGGDELDAMLDAPKKSGPPPKAKLTVDDIMGGVKKNAGKVMPCLKAARSKGEIVPGKYKLILDWDIKPNGSVSGARLKGPGNVMKTSLPACFASQMRKWKFPASNTGAPVKNFPFGPITVKD